MRTLEIILKLCFLALSIALISTHVVIIQSLTALIITSVVLGVVLVVNKHPSYARAHSRQDFVLRKIEGAALILFSCIIVVALYLN